MISKIYQYSPIWTQNLACTIKGSIEKKSRMGGDFSKILKDLKKSEWYKKEEIEDIQIEELKKLVNYCYNNTPSYSELSNLFKTN
ncbi:hypothetical protein ES676_14005 [Bizionia saleffrena]|uniref:Uncharacterized protein n=1 Tax=Bizionia saleffrena TaxID=291189 RepID=A0A8H2LCQ5_9FLAO|nr:hypothetical protein [Bizionia saleffrena]TYB69462.1 hypothetical protein ES676_14005 [Bizionia saleffrena]